MRTSNSLVDFLDRINDNIVVSTIADLLLLVRRSFLNFVISLGIIFLTLALTVADGTIAGMLGVWGASCFVYAVAGHVALKAIGYT